MQIADDESNPHREIKSYGVEVTYWRKNVACLKNDQWSHAQVRSFCNSYWSEYDCDTKHDLAQVLALCNAVFSRGQEAKAQEIRTALNVPHRLT